MRPNNALQPADGRIDWLDRLKGIAFFFVILGHLSLQPTLKSWVFSFHMPVFFFATGCTCKPEKLLQTPFRDYLLKLSKRMLVPYVWMQLLCMPLRYIVFALIKHKETPVKEYLLGILAGNNGLLEAPSNPLYFVLLLFLAELLLFLLVKLSMGDPKKLALFCAALLPFSLLSKNVYLPWHVNVVPAALAMILLGHLFMRLYRAHESAAQALDPVRRSALIGALFAAGALLWFFNGRFGLHGNRYGKDFMCAMLAALCTSAALTLCVMRLPKSRLLTYIGQNTLFYMGLHKPVLLLMEALFPAWKEKQWFVFLAAVVCYLLLVPAAKLCEVFAPFVLGRDSLRGDRTALVCEVLCVIGATCVPYLYFLNHFHGAVLRSGIVLPLLSVVLYAAAIAGIWYVCKRFLPFAFLPKKGAAA